MRAHETRRSIIAGKTYLVTGGTGFIGRAVIKALINAGARVRSLDNDSRGATEKLGPLLDEVEALKGDVRSAEDVKKACRGVDAVMHLAYINGTEFFYTRPELILEVAVKGMMNVIDACLKWRIPELVLASSSEVYQTPSMIPTSESVPLMVPDVMNPRYSYGGGKIISELLAINFGRKLIDRVLIFRPHNVYGPDMGREHVIPQFALRMRDLAARQPDGVIEFPIQGSGVETRSFIHVNDFARAVLAVLDKGEHLGIYHIGTDEEISIRELAELVAASFGRDIQIVPGSLRPGSTTRRCPDVSKITALGFAPLISLREGVQSTVDWYAKLPAAV
jgi:nucleoside-diphosphate-sugar epimerase